MFIYGFIDCVSIELGHNEMYTKACMTDEDSDQHARPRSLIRNFAVRMKNGSTNRTRHETELCMTKSETSHKKSKNPNPVPKTVFL